MINSYYHVAILLFIIAFCIQIQTGEAQEEQITFNDSAYAIFTTGTIKIHWLTAQAKCMSWGGNLITIDSKQIDSLLFYLTTSYTCWIGLNDRDNEAGLNASAFVWVDGSTSTYRQFDTIANPNGEPDDPDGASDCIGFRYGQNNGSDGWDDRVCDAFVFCYFCQKSGDSRGCDLIYEGSCYRAFEVSGGINWLDAQSSCAVWGGDLTSITTQRENSLLYTAISDTVSNCWIGLYERDGDGMYQWVDGTVLSYTNWTGSPPTANNTNDCVQMNTNGAGSWIATDCESTSYSFICKKPSTNTDTTVGRFGELISGGKNFQELDGNTFLYNSSLTLVCGGEENSNAIQWKYSQRSDLSSSQTLTPTYANTVTGLSWITVNNSQQGYYRCEINSSLFFTIGLYDLSLITVAVSGSTYTYIVGIDREDVLLLCDPMDSSVVLSTISWTVLGGNSFVNPLNIYDDRSDLPVQSTGINCFTGSTLVAANLISLKVPEISIGFGSTVSETFSSVNSTVNSIEIPLSTKDITITINLGGKWNLPDNSNYSNSELTISTFTSQNERLYKFYIINWDGVEKCAMQLRIDSTIAELTLVREVTFGDSTYGYFTTTQRITWVDSQLNCLIWEGNLVTIESKQIDSLLYYLIPKDFACWIGLNDRTSEAGTNANAFVWVDGSTSSYRQFDTVASVNPDETDGSKDCVRFRYNLNGQSDGWDDRMCDSSVKCYFCQKSGDSRGCDLIYEGSCYRAFEVSGGINWLDAQSSCAVWGGDLTSITTERENNLLYTAISDTVSNCWIGLYERDGDGMYQWVDGTVLSYTNWTGSAPTANNDNDCVQMNTNGAGSWIATDCESTSYSFICKKPSTDIDITEYTNTPSISTTTLGKIQNESTILIMTETITIACSVTNYTDRVQWYYRFFHGNKVIDKTALSIFSVSTGISSLKVNSNQPGYYSCIINTTTLYTIFIANRASFVKIENFNSPSQQVNYTAGSTNSMLYYSLANIPDSSLRWTTDTVTNGADTQYSIEYPNPVLLSRVFSDVGAGVHTFSCFYRMSPVTLVGSLQLVIRDTATVSISYAGYDNTFSDVANLMFPSPQQVTIPQETQDVSFTCNLTQCMWLIQLEDRTYTETMSHFNIPRFGDGNEGTYSLIRETNSGRNYSTARVSIQVQLIPMEQSLINPLQPIIIVVLIITTIVIAFNVVITILCSFIVKKRKKSSKAIEIYLNIKSNESNERIELHQSNLTSREANTFCANLSSLQSPQTKEYINLPVNISGAEYMTTYETSLISLEPEINIQTPKNSNLANLPPNENNDKIEENKDYVETNPSQPHDYYTLMSVVKEEKKFVSNYIPAKDFSNIYQQYVASGVGNNSLLSVEFQALNEELNEESKKNVESSDEARKESNMCKNPIKNIFPYDENRVVLESPHFDCSYINASYISEYQFIASIHPTGDTLQDFLQMIYQTEASMVIMLTTRKEIAKIIGGMSTRVCYWPKKDEPLKCHLYEASLTSSNETTAFVKQKISLKNTLEGKSHSFIHCLSPIWNQDGTIIELNFVVSLLYRVLKQKQDYHLNPIIIHCEDGISKTGIFLTALNVIKELNVRKLINIFNVVKNLRKQRMHMVPTMAGYTTCYSLMNEYCSIHL